MLFIFDHVLKQSQLLQQPSAVRLELLEVQEIVGQAAYISDQRMPRYLKCLCFLFISSTVYVEDQVNISVSLGSS